MGGGEEEEEEEKDFLKKRGKEGSELGYGVPCE